MSSKSNSLPLLPEGALVVALTVAIAAFMQMLDATIIGTALSQMGSDFGVSPIEVGLGIVVYVLAASIMIPASAWIADQFGARRMFITAMAGFTLASLLCGFSTSLPMFLAARIVQGATGAVMATIGQLILVRSVDRPSLLRLMNISSIPMLVAPVLGPPLGGFLTETVSWPWIFYINVPIGLIGIGLALRYLKPLPRSQRPFDWTGFALNAASLALLLFGLERLASNSSPQSAIFALTAGLVFGLFAVRHLLRDSNPILSLAPLRFHTFRIAVATTLPLIRLPIGALLFVLPIMLQVGFGRSAALAGLALLGHATGDMLMKPLMTRVLRGFGYRNVLIISTAIMAGFMGACGFFTEQTPFTVIVATVFVAGCARSFLMTGLNTLAYDEMPQALVPSAVTLSQIVIQIAAALSVALAAIFFKLSAISLGRSPTSITVQDCQYVLWAMSAIGFFALPALLRLPRDAGDHLAGRTSALPTEE
jgi:EmrB/QacA subfamily drug resistance transporter